MNAIAIIILIIFGVIGLIILYHLLKPYFIKHDTTILFTGGLGSGKTLESVKKAIVLTRKNRLFKYRWGNLKIKCKNAVIRSKNKKALKKYNRLIKQGLNPEEIKLKIRPIENEIPYIKRPLLYSNIPVHFRTHLFGFKKE